MNTNHHHYISHRQKTREIALMYEDMTTEHNEEHIPYTIDFEREEGQEEELSLYAEVVVSYDVFYLSSKEICSLDAAHPEVCTSFIILTLRSSPSLSPLLQFEDRSSEGILQQLTVLLF